LTTQNKNVRFEDLGQREYGPCWTYQETLFDQIITHKKKLRDDPTLGPTDNHLLFVEHPPVITMGRSGQMEHLLISDRQLREKEVSFYKTNRGGDITFHGPGQLVGYPLLNLDNFFTDIHQYLRFLEEVIILTLAEYGLSATRSNGETGVWLDIDTPNARKICAMGVRASRWVTMHGFALNVNTDLSYFDLIVPCGIQGKRVTSLAQELGHKVALDEVKAKVKSHFETVFEVTLI
jgi:lipoyl(octanoyl) transferase